MKRMFQDILKYGDGDHNYLRCPDIWDKNFEVMHSAISLYEVDMARSETVDAEPTIDD